MPEFIRYPDGTMRLWDPLMGDRPAPPNYPRLDNVSIFGPVTPNVPNGEFGPVDPEVAAMYGAAPPTPQDSPATDAPASSIADGVDPGNTGMNAISPSFFNASMFPNSEMAYRFMEAAQSGDKEGVKSILAEADTLAKQKAKQDKIDRMVNLAVMSGLGIASGAPGTYGDFGTQVARGILTGINYDQAMQQQDMNEEYRKSLADSARSRAMSYANQVAVSQQNSAKKAPQTKPITLADGRTIWAVVRPDGSFELAPGPNGGLAIAPKSVPNVADRRGTMRFNSNTGRYEYVYNPFGEVSQPPPRDLGYSSTTDDFGNRVILDRTTGTTTPVNPDAPGKINPNTPVDPKTARAAIEVLRQYVGNNAAASGAVNAFSQMLDASPGMISNKEFFRRINEITRLVERPPGQGNEFNNRLLAVLTGETPGAAGTGGNSAVPAQNGVSPSAASGPPGVVATPSNRAPAETVLAEEIRKANTGGNVTLSQMVDKLVAAGYSRTDAMNEARRIAGISTGND